MTHTPEHSGKQLENDLRLLDDALKAAGVDDTTRAAIRGMALNRGETNHRDVVNLVQAATSFQQRKDREDAAGGSDQLQAIEEAFGTGLSITDLETIEPRVSGFATEFGTEDLAGTLTRFASAEGEEQGLTRGGFASTVGGSFVDPIDAAADGVDPSVSAGFGAARRLIGFSGGQTVERADDGTVWVGGQIVTGTAADRALRAAAADQGEDERVQRKFVGQNDAGQRVETNNFGDVWLDGIQVPTGSQAANNALNQAAENGGAAAFGAGGGGGAAVRLQSLGTDKDGFAVIFNPATGAITKGPQVGFAQVDPRETAAEATRRFNAEQQLREGGFVRDVLSGGRNFVTAALLTRGGQVRPGQATQADIIAGGLGVSSLADALGFGGEPAVRASGGGEPATAPVTTGEGAAATRAEINAGLAAEDRFVTESATVAGGGTVAPGGSGLGQQAGIGTSFPSQISPDGFTGEPIEDLSGFARAEAPPAVKSILGGEEVGFLTTPGATPLASPTTLANLTRGEQEALGTTLQLSEQRTFEEFQQESQQRFRPGGTRRAVRA